MGPARLDWLTGQEGPEAAGREREGPRVRPCFAWPPVVLLARAQWYAVWLLPYHSLAFFFLPLLWSPTPQAQLSLHSLTARAARSVRTVVPTTARNENAPVHIFFSFLILYHTPPIARPEPPQPSLDDLILGSNATALNRRCFSRLKYWDAVYSSNLFSFLIARSESLRSSFHHLILSWLRLQKDSTTAGHPLVFF